MPYAASYTLDIQLSLEAPPASSFFESLERDIRRAWKRAYDQQQREATIASMAAKYRYHAMRQRDREERRRRGEIMRRSQVIRARYPDPSNDGMYGRTRAQLKEIRRYEMGGWYPRPVPIWPWSYDDLDPPTLTGKVGW